MKFNNRQFGELEFEENHVVTFPEGLIGFERHRKFLIVDDEATEPFRWLVSVEDGKLSFPLLDPGLLLPGYAADAATGGGKTVFVVATLRAAGGSSTVNLRSPIVIDNAARTARQVVLDDEGLPLQFPLAPAAKTAAER
ncbi:MAG TPA: flagellar assembly protein FliW [Bacteroidota bacterium]|nr:flagellar assembly protein FliW [Bacteroidota bacterium]